MKGKKGSARPKKIARKAGSGAGVRLAGDSAPTAADFTPIAADKVPTTADFTPIAAGKASSAEDMASIKDAGEDQHNIHNGSAGAFEAAEGGHEDEDSDEDNDDLAMGH
jgi:hypothetical protein